MRALPILGIGIFTTTAPLLAEIFPGWVIPAEAETQVTIFEEGVEVRPGEASEAMYFADPTLLDGKDAWLQVLGISSIVGDGELAGVLNWNGVQVGLYREYDLLSPAFSDASGEWYALGDGSTCSGLDVAFEYWIQLTQEGLLSWWVQGAWYAWQEPVELSQEADIHFGSPAEGIMGLSILDFVDSNGNAIVAQDSPSSVSGGDGEADAEGTWEGSSDGETTVPGPIGPPPSNLEALITKPSSVPPPPQAKILFVRPEGGEFEFDPRTNVVRKIRITPGLLSTN